MTTKSLTDLKYDFFINPPDVNLTGDLSVELGSATIAMPIDIQAVYRTLGDSTTAVLAALAVFTGLVLDGLSFRRFTGRVFADQSGTLNIDHSDDGVTWDSINPIAVVASVAGGFDVPVYARYIRLRYVNGATLQAAFRLSGYLVAN